MKKLILIITVLFIPYAVFAVSDTDLYNQQNISGTYVESGYADIKLNKNAKNTIMDILYHQIVDYIFENMDKETAKYLSIYMPANLQECDDEYLSSIEKEMSLNYASDVLSICREDVYNKNLEYILKNAAEVENGGYYVILESMFKDKTKEILNMKEFSMDKFINILAVNRLISFDGRLFLDSNNSEKVENIKCENNHEPIEILDTATQKPLNKIIINNRDFYVQGCLVKNKNNYFKYITMYEKTNDGYNMYMRIPLFKHKYKKNKQSLNNMIFADINRLHFNIHEPVYDNVTLSFDYMVYRKGTYLQGMTLKSDGKSEVVYSDTSENKFVITENDISLILFENMIKNHCSKNSPACKILQLEEIININQ